MAVIVIWKLPPWLNRLLKGSWFGFMGIVGKGPSGDEPDVALEAHEEIHIAREDALGGGIRRALGAMPARVWGCIRWGIRYLFSRRFRLDEEVAAFKVEMQLVPTGTWPEEAASFAKDLASSAYLWAARSEVEALEVIWNALGALPISEG